MKQPHRVILEVAPAREFDRGLRRGIFEYALQHGPWVFLEETPSYLQALPPQLRLRNMKEWAANGMIVSQSRLAKVRKLTIPTVVVIETDHVATSFHQVICADEEIGRMGASSLIGLGMRHFAYCGFEGLKFSDERGASFKQAVETAGHSVFVHSKASHKIQHLWYEEHKDLARWLTDLPKPVGLLACNDDRARTLAEICWIEGIHVPNDVAILGVDNDEQVCRSIRPPLSSIALGAEQGGYQAAALLASLISGQRPASQFITVSPTQVVARQSTDSLSVDDVQVCKAIQYIRENAGRKLRVSDLVPVAGLSRRALQDAFVRNLGRTPMAEIHNCRADHIARLLVETDLSIGKIAEAVGFEIDAHFARFFARRTGLTPLAYRKKHRPFLE